jgi:hypothetical protein
MLEYRAIIFGWETAWRQKGVVVVSKFKASILKCARCIFGWEIAWRKKGVDIISKFKA